MLLQNAIKQLDITFQLIMREAPRLLTHGVFRLTRFSYKLLIVMLCLTRSTQPEILLLDWTLLFQFVYMLCYMPGQAGDM